MNRFATCSFVLIAGTLLGLPAASQPPTRARLPLLHHVGLNSVDPDRAIAWYLTVWPTAKRTTIAGFPAIEAEMLVLFNKVDRPPPGAWRDDLHRSEPQSAFWHIGAMTNSTNVDARLAPLGIEHLPLFTSPHGHGHSMALRAGALRRDVVPEATRNRAACGAERRWLQLRRRTGWRALRAHRRSNDTRRLLAHAFLPREAALRRELVR